MKLCDKDSGTGRKTEDARMADTVRLLIITALPNSRLDDCERKINFHTAHHTLDFCYMLPNLILMDIHPMREATESTT